MPEIDFRVLRMMGRTIHDTNPSSSQYEPLVKARDGIEKQIFREAADIIVENPYDTVAVHDGYDAIVATLGARAGLDLRLTYTPSCEQLEEAREKNEALVFQPNILTGLTALVHFQEILPNAGLLSESYLKNPKTVMNLNDNQSGWLAVSRLPLRTYHGKTAEEIIVDMMDRGVEPANLNTYLMTKATRDVIDGKIRTSPSLVYILGTLDVSDEEQYPRGLFAGVREQGNILLPESRADVAEKPQNKYIYEVRMLPALRLR